MKKNNKIGVFDSGIGGLTVLKTLVKMLPNEEFIYIGDEKYFPYGEKANDLLKKRIQAIIDKFNDLDCKAIVIACNTASSIYKNFNIESNIPVFEIVKPTSLEAIRATKNNKVAIWATNCTIEQGRYQEELKEVINYPVKASSLVKFIENNQIDTKECDELLDDLILKAADADTLILGCTHFPFVKEQILKKHKFNIVCSDVAITKELKKYLEDNNLLNDNGSGVSLYVTKDTENFKNTYKKYDFNVKAVGVLDI